MRNKGAILYWTNLLNLLLFLGLVGTGVVIKWVLPHGGGQSGGRGMGLGRGAGGTARGDVATFWTLGRHDWGEVHFWIAVAMLAGIAIHLLLHLGWIKTSTLRYLSIGHRTPRARTGEAATTLP